MADSYSVGTYGWVPIAGAGTAADSPSVGTYGWVPAAAAAAEEEVNTPWFGTNA